MRNKRKPPHRQCNCYGNDENGENGETTKKQFDTGDIDFEINMNGDAYGVNISPPSSDKFPYVLRDVLTIEPESYKTITGKIKDILEKERFLDYFSSIVKVHTNNGEYDTILYMNNQQGTTGYLVMPSGYIFIALPITTLTCTYREEKPDITFYIPLLIDILNNKVYDVTDELPDEIAYMIDYYFKTLLGFAYVPKEEYRLTMIACQFLPYPDNRYGIITATGYIGFSGREYGGATMKGTVTEIYNPSMNTFDGLSIGYTFYEK